MEWGSMIASSVGLRKIIGYILLTSRFGKSGVCIEGQLIGDVV
jgi:hypothetical protein